MEDLDFDKIESDLKLDEITESDLENPKKEKREYKKKKKFDPEKESEAVITILQFFSGSLLKNEIPEKQAEFHKETVRQISEQYEVKITEYILFIRIFVSISLLLIHYYISLITMFRKKEEIKIDKEKDIKNEIVS